MACQYYVAAAIGAEFSESAVDRNLVLQGFVGDLDKLMHAFAASYARVKAHHEGEPVQ